MTLIDICENRIIEIMKHLSYYQDQERIDLLQKIKTHAPSDIQIQWEYEIKQLLEEGKVDEIVKCYSISTDFFKTLMVDSILEQKFELTANIKKVFEKIDYEYNPNKDLKVQQFLDQI